MNQLVDSIINMGICAVYFSSRGEPTLYPKLTECINKLYVNGVECSIITNGSCFEQMGLILIADMLIILPFPYQVLIMKCLEQ